MEKQYNRNSGKPLIVNIGNKITLEVKSTPGNSLERVYLGRNDNMNIGLNENSIFIIMINNQMKTYKSNGKNVLTLSYENTTCKAA